MPADRSLQDAWAVWIERLARWEWYMTLTFAESVHPEAAEKRWEAFVRRVEGKRGRAIAWVRALEYQRRGVIHFHALLAGMEFLAYDAVRQLWPWGFSWIEPYQPGRGANYYLGKYIAKGGEIDLGGPLATSAPGQLLLNLRRPCPVSRTQRRAPAREQQKTAREG